MTKKELIAQIALDAGVSLAAATRMFESMIFNITRTLKRGEMVQITNFGAFSAVKREGRMVVNPRTQQPMKIKAHKAVKFTPGKKLKADIGCKVRR